MRKFIFMAIAAIFMALPSVAQDVNSNPDKLILEGTILGIGVTLYWNRIK